MYIVACYLVYLAVSIAVTVWVAGTLRKNGRVFLVDAFQGREALADSVNHLLVAGFYLINVGYVASALATKAPVEDARQAVELVSSKLGTILLVLGAMHFFNLYVFHRIRQRGQEHLQPPPLRPHAQFAPLR